MARIFPEKLVGNGTPEVARAFLVLKSLPDDWQVWLHLTLWESDAEAPDFLVLDSEQRALLIKVSRATSRQAQQSPQLQLLDFEQETAVPGSAAELCLRTFLNQVAKEGVPKVRVTGVVLFPNLDAEDLQAIEQSGTAPEFVRLDRSWLYGKGAASWGELFPAQPLDAEMVLALRAQFSPEIVVPSAFVPRIAARQRNLKAKLTNYLLDYNQEAVVKSDLELDTYGEQVVRKLRFQVVNGVAGSGKTLVLLYRLRLLQARFPKKSYLVLTHNRPLIREMRVRYQMLDGTQPRGVRWHTFMGWCRRHWPKDEQYNPISGPWRDRWLREIWRRELHDTSITLGMFRSELEWVKDQGIATREEYLGANRRGRGFRLTRSQRRQIFEAIRLYQLRLKEQEVMDWWDVPLRYRRWLEEGQVHPPQYDVVLIDEAQFFARVWFDIVRELVSPEKGYLFMAADSTQGFLRRGESWRSIAGMDARGHSYRLRRSYRTTRPILTFALAFYRQRLPEDKADWLQPDLAGMPKGHPPILLQFSAPQDERARLVDEIARAVEKGLSLRHILVLHASARGATAILEMLNQRLGPNSARDPKDELPGEFIRVTTLNACTGLESPTVFLAGIHELFEKEGSLHLSEGERIELVQMHTKQLYMAFTRAGQRLVLTYVGEPLPQSLLELAKYGLLEIA